MPTSGRALRASGRARTRRWPFVLCLSALVLATLAVPASAATPAAWPTEPTTLGTSVTFYGRGYGHGVGMSQYGARGRALAGQTATTILAAYFKGTTRGTVDPKANVRVLVLSNLSALAASPLQLYGRGGTWTIDGIAKTFPADAQLKAWRTSTTVAGATSVTWTAQVSAADKTVLHTGPIAGSPYVRPAQPATQLQLWSKPSAYDTYRGALRLLLTSTAVSVVDHVGLDLYLRGVVPVEMSPSWPAEALKAQAIAARSYGALRLHPTTGSYDIYDDSRSQVYRGSEAESAATNAAVTATAGVVLKYGTAIVNAFFHSTAGGATENNEYAFVGSSGAVTSVPLPYLRGISDRDAAGRAYDAGAPYYGWTTSALTRAQLSTMFRADSRTNVGDLLKLDLTKRGVSGRLYRVTLIGSTGMKTVSADVFRTVYNARRPAGTGVLRANMFDTQPVP